MEVSKANALQEQIMKEIMPKLLPGLLLFTLWNYATV